MGRELGEVFCKVCGKSSNEDKNFNKKSELCNRHYLQIKRHGKPLPLGKERQKNKHICDICGDSQSKRYITWSHDDEFKGKVLCGKHYHQLLDNGYITDNTPSQKHIERKCCVCGSTDKIIYRPKDGKMYCRRHYDHVYIYGKIKERTIFDRNEYLVDGDITYIYLRNSKQEIIAKTIIDTEDLEKVIKYKWTLGTWNYAETVTHEKESLLIQRVIMDEYRKEYIPDHINRDTLDNRKQNLRITDKSGNAINAGLRTNNKSGVTGVSLDKRTNFYRSYINYKGKRLELGMFHNKEDAIKARLEAENKYYGIYSPQKHLFEQYNININKDNDNESN